MPSQWKRKAKREYTETEQRQLDALRIIIRAIQRKQQEEAEKKEAS